MVNHFLMVFYLLIHVQVAFRYLDFHGSLTVFPVQVLGSVLHQFLAFHVMSVIVVPDDVLHGGCLRASLHAVQVEETLPSLGACRGFINRKQVLVFHGHEDGILKHALGIAGVRGHAVDRHDCPGGIEVFVGKFPKDSAVHRISVGSVQFLHIHMVRAPANLLIRGEKDADSRMGMFRVFHQKLCQGHDFRNPCLVVRAQQGGAVRDNQVLALKLCQAGIIGNPGDNILFLVEDDIPSIIAGHNTGLYIGSRHVHGRIHMCNQGKSRPGAPGRGRDVCVDTGVLVHLHIMKAKSF